MSFTDAETLELRAGLPRFGVFFHLASVPAVRYWLGVGNIKPGINAVDLADGEIYKGFGELLDVPSLDQLFNATPQRIDISVAGVPQSVFAEVAPLISDQQIAIQGKECYIGWAAMDTHWDLLSAIHWEWFGFADLIRVSHGVADSVEAPSLWTMTLSCGDWMTGRRRIGLSFLTDHDQKSRSLLLNPGENDDRACERTGMYGRGVDKIWPDF